MGEPRLSARQWIRTADSPLPAAVRSARRLAARVQARATNRTIPAFMTGVVESVPVPATVPAKRSSSKTRRVVAVSTYPLHPRQAGGQIRAWHLAHALTLDTGAEVSAVTFTTDPARGGEHRLAERLTETCILFPPAHVRRESKLRLVSGDVSVTDVAAGLMWNGVDAFTDALRRAIDGADAAVLVQPYLVGAVATLAAGIDIICDEHNDELLLKRSILPESTGGKWMLDHVDDIERAATEGATLLTTTTDADLESLGARYRIGGTSAVVPNGVDTAAIAVAIGDDRAPRKRALAARVGVDGARPIAIFVGSGHLPNIDAGRAIIGVAREYPDIDFLLAGRHSRSLGRHLPPNVRLLGPVPDDLLDLLLTGGDLALNPMTVGSGSNLKLLTYLAAGLPVVSTAVGARGIDADEAGVHTVDLEHLDAGIAHLVGHDNQERSAAGRHYVEEHCDWRAIGRRFAHLTAETVFS